MVWCRYQALAQVLKQNRSMTYINLSGNHIGIGGMEAIEASTPSVTWV